MIAMTVVAIAGAAMLTSVAGAVSSCNDSIFQTVGRGLAEQLMDEVSAARFPTGNTTYVASVSRAAFATLDDYSNLFESPPRTKGGELLGSDQSNGNASTSTATTLMTMTSPLRSSSLCASQNFLNRFTRRVVVERVQPNATGGWSVVAQQTSYRRVTVTVLFTTPGRSAQQVAVLTRTFSAISQSPS